MGQVHKPNLGKRVIMKGFLKEGMPKLRLEGQELAEEEEGGRNQERRKNGSR